MKIKTSELTGAALNWAVQEIEYRRMLAKGEHVKQWALDDHKSGVGINPYSTDWLWGGPIIEEEFMQVFNYAESSPNEPWFVEKNHFGRHHKAGRSYARGSTILIAAMRCYVSVKLGDEVDIPDELLP